MLMSKYDSAMTDAAFTSQKVRPRRRRGRHDHTFSLTEVPEIMTGFDLVPGTKYSNVPYNVNDTFDHMDGTY